MIHEWLLMMACSGHLVMIYNILKSFSALGKPTHQDSASGGGRVLKKAQKNT
jgi:flagellar biosynthesis protein FliR